MTLTAQAIADQLPDTLKYLIQHAYGDLGENVMMDPRDLEEAKAMLPVRPVIDAVLCAAGLAPDLSETKLEAANSWIADQKHWQQRSARVQEKLYAIEPYDRARALEQKVPKWMFMKWAKELVYDWSPTLQDAVVDAELYCDTGSVLVSES